MKTHTFRVYANGVPNQINARKVHEQCKICKKRPRITVFIKKTGETMTFPKTCFLYVIQTQLIKRYHISMP